MSSNTYDKQDFPVANVRRFLEPGPIVLVSSAHKGETNIMTMGWHMIMEFEPSLVGCYIWSENHSRELVRKSGECVINVPTADMATKVVGIGNCSGRDTDKFAKFAYPSEELEDRGAADRRVLRKFRMPAARCRPHRQIQLVRLGGGEGARRPFPALSAHPALPGGWRIHALGCQYPALPPPVQAGNALTSTSALRFVARIR